jgi:hypothetical protein
MCSYWYISKQRQFNMLPNQGINTEQQRKRETMETMFSVRLVLEPYNYEWNTLINAKYTAN